jgi:hypothetical protein
MVHQMVDQQLLHVAQDKTNPALQQAAMMEMMSRQRMRGGSPAQGQPGPGTPPNQQHQPTIPPGPSAAPPGGGVAQLPAPGVQGMAGGGIVAFDSGGTTTQDSQPWYAGIRDFMFDYPGKVQTPDRGQGFFPTSYGMAVPPSRGATGQDANDVRTQRNAPGYFGALGSTLAETESTPSNLVERMVPPSSYIGRGTPAYTNSRGEFVPGGVANQAAPTSGVEPGSLDANDQRLANARAAAAAAAPKTAAPPQGNGTPQGNTPEPYDAFSDMKRFNEFLLATGRDRSGTTDPAAETVQKQLAAAEAAKRANSGLALLHAGAAMLQNTSPFASVALGKGVDAYATSKEAGQVAEQASLSHAAQLQNEAYKTQMGYMGEIDKTRMYGLSGLYGNLQLKAAGLSQQSALQSAAQEEKIRTDLQVQFPNLWMQRQTAMSPNATPEQKQMYALQKAAYDAAYAERIRQAQQAMGASTAGHPSLGASNGMQLVGAGAPPPNARLTTPLN